MLLAMIAIVVTVVVGWQAIHRSAPLVQRWQPSSFPRRSAGELSVLDSGPTGHDDERVVVLMHGLGATGEYFGAFYDGLSRRHRVVIFDVLGFGHSLDENRTDFGIDDHVAAFDSVLGALDLDERPIVVAAHSMSSAIALAWADRHRDRVDHVYLWGPPIYPDEAAARAVARHYGWMGRLFFLDTRWAERACRINCANRTLSGTVMAAMAPRWPVEVSSRASRHTWEAYHLSLRNLVLEFNWPRVLPASVPVTIWRGDDDPIGDASYIDRIAGGAAVVSIPDGGHHLALTHPELLFDAIGR